MRSSAVQEILTGAPVLFLIEPLSKKKSLLTGRSRIESANINSALASWPPADLTDLKFAERC